MEAKLPNILFFLPDQHRPDWLGGNPNLPVRTPNLDGLARDGTYFTRAFTPSPLCSPARACLATGLDYGRCGVRDNGQNTPLALPTYYRQLRDVGYEVAGVGKLDLHKPDLDWGLDGSKLLKEYGFTHGIDNEGKGDAIVAYRRNGYRPKGPYMQYLHEQGLDRLHYAMYEPHFDSPDGWLNFAAVTPLPDDAYCDNWVAANGAALLRGFAPGRPWHLVINFVGPHGPFDVTPDMRARWQDVAFIPPHANQDPDRRTVLERQQNYAAMIENIDHHVGEMLRIVAERGELDRTLIVYASDHGEMLGDHGLWGKSVWYTPASGVPLIIAGPGVRRGVRSDALVSLHDLAATFLDFAEAPPLPQANSRSLRRLLAGDIEAHRAVVTSALNDWRMVYDGRYKVVITEDRAPILYDTQEDPFETVNVASSHPNRVETLCQMLNP